MPVVRAITASVTQPSQVEGLVMDRFTMSIMACLSSALVGACSTFGIRSGTEEPRYEIIEVLGNGVEVRRYGPRLAAAVDVAGDEEEARSTGFRKLADYIFGRNQGRRSIAMTAPVGQTAAEPERIAMTAPVGVAAATDGGWRIIFFMPSTYSRDTLPEPVDPDIVLLEVPAQTYAVYRFTGARDASAVADATRRLRGTLEGSRWQPDGPSHAWFYDPPWTIPWLRRNEVAIPVRDGAGL